MKRRVVREAVAENVDVIRGMPPRAVRPMNRLTRVWLRRAPLLLVPLTLAASSYLVSESGGQAILPVPITRAAIAAAGQAGLPVLHETTTSMERVTSAAFPLAVRRVVLDAGHGGSDPGATTAQVTEKAITLDIGRRLRTLLEAEGFEVIVTRSDDRTIALRERARLANDANGDVFVSIHVNTIAKHTASRGIETYYLGPTNDPSLTQLAAAENRVSGYSLGDMRKLLDGVYADARRDESHQLASAVQQQLYTNLRSSDPGLENWGVKRAPFIVLVATDMPAVLAEVGCLSNDKEAAMLARADYRQKIADALFHGIRAYASANDGPKKKRIQTHG
ncbi:MAG TPA: N-acetylmuramoyl-L-alanine amidase [Thermoanaerobaculia bacterium]|nr:N-acetylmuramoyl-L-alanine amidase [Thermoanaerobaculia bacterium]